MQSDLLYFSVVDIGDFFRSFVDTYKRKKVIRKINSKRKLCKTDTRLRRLEVIDLRFKKKKWENQAQLANSLRGC